MQQLKFTLSAEAAAAAATQRKKGAAGETSQPGWRDGGGAEAGAVLQSPSDGSVAGGVASSGGETVGLSDGVTG